MQTHIHLFVYDRLGKISLFMNELHGEYAKYFNYDTGSVGHVFGERFNNKIVQVNEYGLWLSRYIHRQSVEAGFFSNPIYYPWTSYHEYIGGKPSGFVKPDVILRQFGEKENCAQDYEKFVNDSDDGPVDWSMKSAEVVGNEKFQRATKQYLMTDHQQNVTDKQMYELAIERFKVKPHILTRPRGRKEKRLRCKIVVWLVNELGFKPARLARLLHISNTTVHRALTRKR